MKLVVLCAVSLCGHVGCTNLRSAAARASSGIRLRFDAPVMIKSGAARHKEIALPQPMVDVTKHSDFQALCDFSAEAPPLHEWHNLNATILFDSFLQSFLENGLTIELTDGSLLGAYRHHGTIPHDEDMDAIFNVCRFARMANTTALAGLTCTAVNEKRVEMGNQEFDYWVWTEALAPVLESKGISYIDPSTAYQANGDIDGLQEIRLSDGEQQWNGGWPDMTGVGMDLHITTEDEIDDSICKCTYGTTAAYCPRDSRLKLKAEYGQDFMVPISQCEYYAKLAIRDHHADWNGVSKKDCQWAAKARRQLDTKKVLRSAKSAR